MRPMMRRMTALLAAPLLACPPLAAQGELLVAAFDSNNVVRFDATTGALIGELVAPFAGSLEGTRRLREGRD